MIDWITGEPTVPTDPRELAVWNWNIERTYAYNTSSFMRPQYADNATRARIAGEISALRDSLSGNDGIDVYLGPSPIVFHAVEDGVEPNAATITYCAIELWERYGHSSEIRTKYGRIHAIKVMQDDNGKWRVSNAGLNSLDVCSLEGAAVGYFVPRPEPKAPGTYSVDDLVVPTWYEEDGHR